MFTIKEGYGIPIFADGSVRFTVLKDGQHHFSVAHGVRGLGPRAQEANIEEGRAKLQAFVDLANAGAKVTG